MPVCTVEFPVSINDDFCLGWNSAKNIITQIYRTCIRKITKIKIVERDGLIRHLERRSDMENVTVSDLIKLLDKEGNRRGGATGKERILSIQVNGEFIGYITSAKLDGWGDGLVTDVCLEVETE